MFFSKFWANNRERPGGLGFELFCEHILHADVHEPDWVEYNRTAFAAGELISRFGGRSHTTQVPHKSHTSLRQ